MQDTTVGAWVVTLHEQFMGWVPSNISYVYAWYVHAYLGIYQDMHVYAMHILVCTKICMYVHAYLGMYMSYTCMYRFTKSCPGGQDSR